MCYYNPCLLFLWVQLSVFYFKLPEFGLVENDTHPELNFKSFFKRKKLIKQIA